MFRITVWVLMPLLILCLAGADENTVADAAPKMAGSAALAPTGGQPWQSPASGMVFVWVPSLGLWVGKYEVTNGEYRRKEPGHNSGAYRNHTLNRDLQPVLADRDMAYAFCDWLTRQDRHAGLPEGFRYRLPSHREWTILAKCGDERKHPWGNAWPPPSGKAGNYADAAAKTAFPDWQVVAGYADGHAVTCDVAESGANAWGLYGIGGNVWELCHPYPSGTLCGGSWLSDDPGETSILYAHVQMGGNGAGEARSVGFRCVLSR